MVAKFLAVHTIGGSMTPEAGEPVAKAIKANSNTDAYWIRSWYTPDDGKFYCEWDAKDADAVSKVCAAAVAQSGVPFPLDGVFPITLAIDGEAYR
jgi:Nickel responsive protein SCO4226-like